VRIACTILLAAACGTENDVVGPPPIEFVPSPAEDAPVVRSEVWHQAVTPVVDVLFVVDDSASMVEEATALAANVDVFLDWFVSSALDWHVGVISTNMESVSARGKLVEARGLRWIDPTTPDPAGVFAEMVPFSAGVDHVESGRQAIYTAVEVQGEDHNSGFLRPEGSLHVVVASDEDDHSPTPELGEFIDWFSTLRPATKRSFSAVTVLAPCGDAVEVGQGYIDVSEAVGGVLRSICEPDWAPVLDAVGGVSAAPIAEFFLSEIPVSETLVVGVTLSEEPIDLAWAYEQTRNSVRFDVPPPLGAVVSATYTVRGG
jgi:hypothetical protein